MYGLITNTVKKHKVFQYEALAQAINQTRLVNDIKARHLAATNKRLDVCAAETAHILHLVPELDVQDKICLEIGCGWVLSHAITFYLLGAKKVIATDLLPVANVARLHDAIHHSVAYIVRDVLSPFGQHEEIRARLDALLAIKEFNEQSLERLGIQYVAPFDFATEQFTDNVDVIYSRSVLNHLPRQQVAVILQNVYDSLRPGGLMLHNIHLEDVKNFDTAAPFAFYEISADEYLPEYDGLRGNRIRASAWEKLMRRIAANKARVYYRWTRAATALPAKIDESIQHTDDEDLRTSHLGIMAWRD